MFTIILISTVLILSAVAVAIVVSGVISEHDRTYRAKLEKRFGIK